MKLGESSTPFKHTWRLWCIFIVLCLLSFLSGLDATIITTSLPTIAHDIGGETQYAWIANSYLFASTAPQPLYGQISNIFGRRNPILVAVSLFALGSGIGGGAKNVDTLIAGRVIQGLGTAGLYVLSDIIICDLVPPRHRGSYLSAVISSAGIATTIGPVVGAALAQVQ
jgi:MFS family permease